MHFQLNPSYTPTQRVTHGSIDVQRRLQELDQTLDEAVLSMAIQHGYSARLDVTDAHPSTAAGTGNLLRKYATGIANGFDITSRSLGFFNSILAFGVFAP